MLTIARIRKSTNTSDIKMDDWTGYEHFVEVYNRLRDLDKL